MACACSALYIVNLKGDILLEKRYRDDVERSIADNFRTQILNKEVAVQAPIRTLGSVTFMYVRHNDVYMLCLTRNNANAMLAIKFMTSLCDLFKAYIGESVCEKSVKNNFVLLYELLDEVNDFGFPQLTDPAVLKNFIFQKGVRSEKDMFKQNAIQAQSATLTVTGAVSWRREGIKYKKNEVFLDIVEQVNLLMTPQGSVLRCDVVGRLLMKCYLSDVPELRLGLNDKLEDCTFHQCVNLSTFEAQKVVTFIPPDGEFELMRYRSQDNISVPFKTHAVVNEVGRTRVECCVAVKSTYNSKLFATNVVILIPVPDYTSKANIEVPVGKAKYDATKKALVWKIRRFLGSAEYTLRAEVNLVSTTKDRKPWTKPPISIQFQIPMYGASGLRVQYLRILERKQGNAYKAEKWVRKMCKSGDYLIRC